MSGDNPAPLPRSFVRGAGPVPAKPPPPKSSVVPPPLGDDEVTALIERLHSHARHATVLGNTQSTHDEYLAEWLYRFASEGHEAAAALERLAAEVAGGKAAYRAMEERFEGSVRMAVEDEDDGWARQDALKAERDALPEKIAQAIEAAKVDPWHPPAGRIEQLRRMDMNAARDEDAAIARSFGAATPGEPS